MILLLAKSHYLLFELLHLAELLLGCDRLVSPLILLLHSMLKLLFPEVHIFQSLLQHLQGQTTLFSNDSNTCSDGCVKDPIPNIHGHFWLSDCSTCHKLTSRSLRLRPPPSRNIPATLSRTWLWHHLSQLCASWHQPHSIISECIYGGSMKRVSPCAVRDLVHRNGLPASLFAERCFSTCTTAMLSRGGITVPCIQKHRVHTEARATAPRRIPNGQLTTIPCQATAPRRNHADRFRIDTLSALAAIAGQQQLCAQIAAAHTAWTWRRCRDARSRLLPTDKLLSSCCQQKSCGACHACAGSYRGDG